MSVADWPRRDFVRVAVSVRGPAQSTEPRGARLLLARPQRGSADCRPTPRIRLPRSAFAKGSSASRTRRSANTLAELGATNMKCSCVTALARTHRNAASSFAALPRTFGRSSFEQEVCYRESRLTAREHRRTRKTPWGALVQAFGSSCTVAGEPRPGKTGTRPAQVMGRNQLNLQRRPLSRKRRVVRSPTRPGSWTNRQDHGESRRGDRAASRRVVGPSVGSVRFAGLDRVPKHAKIRKFIRLLHACVRLDPPESALDG